MKGSRYPPTRCLLGGQYFDILTLDNFGDIQSWVQYGNMGDEA